MIYYIIKRLLSIPILLLFLSALIFSLVIFLSPYERLAVFIPNPDAAIMALPLDDLIARYGLDKPFYVQYYNWLRELFHGNLGWSASAGMPVAEAISRYFPATTEMMLLSTLFIIPGGLLVGTYAAIRHGKLTDQVTRLGSIIGIGLPEFVFGLVALAIFYAWLGWFPPGRLSLWAQRIAYCSDFKCYTGMNLIDSVLNGRFDVLADVFRHLFLPALTYSAEPLSVMIRMMRSSVLETLGKDYVTTARAKGLPERLVIRKHACRNALLPVLTLGGGIIARMLGGAVVVEVVFDYPGMGRFLVAAALGLDFPAVLGISLLVGTIIILINLLIDFLYTVLNPIVIFTK